MVKTFFLLVITLWLLLPAGWAQTQTEATGESEISRLLRVLAADSLKGRGNHTPEQLKATQFIAKEFDAYGLQPLQPFFTFWQPFFAADSMGRDVLVWNQDSLKSHAFHYFTLQLMPDVKSLSDFEVVEVTGTPEDSLLYPYWNGDRDVLLWYKTNSSGLPQNVLLPQRPPSHDVLWVAQPQKPERLSLTVHPDYRSKVLFNVIGVLPGRSKRGEALVFSAHYDHLGVANRKRGDVIFNGANDNASGTSALLALARYYAAKGDNERTLIFCAFAGEELGLLGSKAFVKHLMPDSIAAVINLEMLGRAQYGKNKVFITGASYSDFGQLFSQNLKGSGVKVVAEPQEEKELFKRSDNYPFAQEGVPAHTIMSSDDDDACYHRVCDEVERLDVAHMAAVIQGIIQGCAPMVGGAQTPSRINKKRL